MFTRREILTSLAANALLRSAPNTETRNKSADCIFGAIRWDGQYCDTAGEPCFEEERALGDPKWQFRAPLHTEIVGRGKIKFEPTQETFDNEIVAAERAGLKYWAYAAYGRKEFVDLHHSMMRGLAFHRASNLKDRMKYTLIVSTDTLGHTSDFDFAVNTVVRLMKDSNFQTIMGGRRILFLAYTENELAGHWSGSIHNLAAAIDDLRKAAVKEGLGNPYIILLSSHGEQVRSALGLDAISMYAITPPVNSYSTFRELVTSVGAFWEKEVAETQAGMVPTVMVGWDPRPRNHHQPAYDHSDWSKNDPDAHTTPPTPAEFAEECKNAVAFINAHPKQCNARLALIYAWDEDSEGGPLEPTLGDRSASLLVAARPIMR